MSDPHDPPSAHFIQSAPLDELMSWSHEGQNLLTHLVLRNDFALAEALLSRGFPPDHNNDGFASSALSEAAFYGNVAAARFLILQGASIVGHPHEDMPPLHVALMRGHDQVAIELLKAGASVNTTDEGGQTALDRASSPQMIELIRNAGAKRGRG